MPSNWLAGDERQDFPVDASVPPRPTLSAHTFGLIIRTVDLAVLGIAGTIASLCCADGGGSAQARVMATLALISAGAFVLLVQQAGAYAPSRLRDLRFRFRLILTASLVSGLAAIIACIVLPLAAPLVRLWPALWMATAGSMTLATAAITARIARTPANAVRLARRVAVVGINDYSRAFISRVTGDSAQQVAFAGLYDDGSDTLPGDGDPAVLGQLDELVIRSRRERIDAIVLALPLGSLDRIIRARALLRAVNADIYMASEVIDLTCKAGCVDRLGSSAVIKIGSRPLSEWQMLQKGAMDGVISAILLMLGSPFLLLIALAIRLESAGPVLFRQPRLGFNNNLFSVFKFRTMYHHARDLHADRQTTRDDPRITRVGRILRRTSVDELPQLLNVLRGEMSLVGPRPHALNTKAGDQLFQDAVADYALRHRVKPGITGWAQVNGWRGETRTRDQIEQRVAHDLFYIDNWSLSMDVKIVVMTVLNEFTNKEVY